MPLLVGPFKLLNSSHAQKDLEGYLYFKWLTTSIRWHDPKGYIATHFQRLGLTTSYRHELYPNDILFEDANTFKKFLNRMRARNLPGDMIASLGQNPELERLEWQKQCFLEDPNKKKGLEVMGDKDKTDGSSKQQPMLSKGSTVSKSKYSGLDESHPIGFGPSMITTLSIEP